MNSENIEVLQIVFKKASALEAPDQQASEMKYFIIVNSMVAWSTGFRGQVTSFQLSNSILNS